MNTFTESLVRIFQESEFNVAAWADLPTDEESLQVACEHLASLLQAPPHVYSDENLAVVLFVCVSIAQGWGVGGFHPEFERRLGRSVPSDREEVKEQFCRAANRFQFPLPEEKDVTQRNLTYYLMHAGFPRENLNDVIDLVDFYSKKNLSPTSEAMLKDFVVHYPYIQNINANVRRLLQTGWKGTLEVWQIIEKLIRSKLYNLPDGDYLEQLPPIIDRAVIRQSLSTLQQRRRPEALAVNEVDDKLIRSIRLRYTPHDGELTAIFSDGVRHRVLSPPPSGIYQPKVSGFEDMSVDLFYHRRQDSAWPADVVVMLFDARTGLLVSPESIRENSIPPGRYYVFCNRSLPGREEELLATDWYYWGWQGRELTVSPEECQQRRDIRFFVESDSGRVDVVLPLAYRYTAAIEFANVPVTEADFQGETLSVFGDIPSLRSLGATERIVLLARYNGESRFDNVERLTMPPWTDCPLNTELSPGVYRVKPLRGRGEKWFAYIPGLHLHWREEYPRSNDQEKQVFVVEAKAEGRLQPTDDSLPFVLGVSSEETEAGWRQSFDINTELRSFRSPGCFPIRNSAS